MAQDGVKWNIIVNLERKFGSVKGGQFLYNLTDVSSSRTLASCSELHRLCATVQSSSLFLGLYFSVPKANKPQPCDPNSTSHRLHEWSIWATNYCDHYETWHPIRIARPSFVSRPKFSRVSGQVSRKNKSFLLTKTFLILSDWTAEKVKLFSKSSKSVRRKHWNRFRLATAGNLQREPHVVKRKDVTNRRNRSTKLYDTRTLQ
jgi:hypothetical protein